MLDYTRHDNSGGLKVIQMQEMEINIPVMQNRPIIARNEDSVRTLSTMLEILKIDHDGNRYGNRKRQDLVRHLPRGLSAVELDAFLSDDVSAPRRSAVELLTTENIESTTLILEQVLRTVIAGGEKFKVIRECGVPIYPTTSNSLRVPLGQYQRNAEVVAEGAEGQRKTQEYDKRNFPIVKYMAIPDISFEMIEDGLVDVVSEEIFYAGASLENRLNYDALTALATNSLAANLTTVTGAGTPGTALSVLKQAKKLVKKQGYFADTVIMSTDFENDILQNANIVQAYQFGNPTAIQEGHVPHVLYGLNTFVTDNGSATVDGTHPWQYSAASNVGAVVMAARQAAGIAMRRDRTVNKFDDIVRELHTITCTMRVCVNYLHPEATSNCLWLT